MHVFPRNAGLLQRITSASRVISRNKAVAPIRLEHGQPDYHVPMRTNQPTQILVVDDDPELRDLLREYLTQQGFAVSVMHDGDGLQARLERERPALIVLDLMMPKVDGLTALRNLRARTMISR